MIDNSRYCTPNYCHFIIYDFLSFIFSLLIIQGIEHLTIVVLLVMIFCTFIFFSITTKSWHERRDWHKKKKNHTKYLNFLVGKIQHENMDDQKGPCVCLGISVNISHATGQLQWFGLLKITFCIELVWLKVGIKQIKIYGFNSILIPHESLKFHSLLHHQSGWKQVPEHISEPKVVFNEIIWCMEGHLWNSLWWNVPFNESPPYLKSQHH